MTHCKCYPHLFACLPLICPKHPPDTPCAHRTEPSATSCDKRHLQQSLLSYVCTASPTTQWLHILALPHVPSTTGPFVVAGGRRQPLVWKAFPFGYRTQASCVRLLPQTMAPSIAARGGLYTMARRERTRKCPGQNKETC